MNSIVLFFLTAGTILYVIFAGADFGAGIMELFPGKQSRKGLQNHVTHAMGPVWEANHIWIILAIVIVFTAYPEAYRTISISLHIPLTLMLVGIVFRGCAFTFRHYDIIEDKAHVTYSRVFAVSSVATPLLQGMVAGALFLGWIPPEPTDFVSTYILPWCNPFCFIVGIFLCCLYSLLAASFLIGEVEAHNLKIFFSRRVKKSIIFCLIGLVLIVMSAELSGVALVQRCLNSISSVLLLLSTFLLMAALWQSVGLRYVWRPRILAGGVASCITLVWAELQYPYLVSFNSAGTRGISVLTDVAPDATLYCLVIALLVGGASIFPALAFLLKAFKGSH